MGITLKEALRLGKNPVVAAAGSGGKTTALFSLAHQLNPPVILTATTHLHCKQIEMADRHFILTPSDGLGCLDDIRQEVLLLTGPFEGDRTTGINLDLLNEIHKYCQSRGVPLLIEADGARQRPLKAPADHEPVIPPFVTDTLVCAGMQGLDQPLSNEIVHRPEIFARLGSCLPGAVITTQVMARVLLHPHGGLKSIPPASRRVALLNQADNEHLQAQAKALARSLLAGGYHAVLTASLAPADKKAGQKPRIHSVHEPVAGIVLAAGRAKRYGAAKQLLEWHDETLVRHSIKTALKAGCQPVILILGHAAEVIKSTLTDLPVTIQINCQWRSGQGSSVRSGVTALPAETGAAVFLLADQPLVTPDLIQALIERHEMDLAPIVAPRINGQRSNPVLFDRATFPDLLKLDGDRGGRTLFRKYPPVDLPWKGPDPRMDIDTPDDYQRLLGDQ